MLNLLEAPQTRDRNPAGKLETLWIYGDSVGDFFYKSIIRQPLCKKTFQRCNNTYNWVYTIPERNLTRGRLENDDKDFSVRRVLTEIFRVISQPFMDSDKSVLLLNLGLHYVHTINFTTYKVLIDKTIRLLNERFKTNKKSWRFRGQLVWKTTTAINKEKYGDPRTNARHSTSIRFLTYQVRLLSKKQNTWWEIGVELYFNRFVFFSFSRKKITSWECFFDIRLTKKNLKDILKIGFLARQDLVCTTFHFLVWPLTMQCTPFPRDGHSL